VTKIENLRARLPLIVAVAATTAWLLTVGAYVQIHGGWAPLTKLAPFDLALLIAAAFAPLAALWLIIMVIEQQRALAQFARRFAEMAAQNRQSLQQAESQARTLTQLQAQGARMQALDTRRLALNDLASSTAVLAERLGVLNRETSAAAWVRYGAGDTNVFVQAFLNFSISHPDIASRIAEAVVRDGLASAALAAFVRRYDQIAAASGDDKLAAEILADGALGRGFRLFKSADALAARMMQANSHDSADMDSAREHLDNLSERLEAAAPSV